MRERGPGTRTTATIAVVTPAHNAARFLGETIASVQGQTFEDWRLVVVDDGSRDETLDIACAVARDDPRVQTVFQPNQGPARARETGLALSGDSPFVVFLDADDVFEPLAFAALLDRLETAPDSPAAHGLARHIDAAGQRIRPGQSEHWTRAHRRVPHGLQTRALRDDEPTPYEALINGNAIQAPGAVLVRREAKLAVGPFDPTLAHSEDWDMWIRLSSLGPIAFHPGIVLNYRKHGNNRSDDREGLARVRRVVSARAYGRAKQEAAQQWPALVSVYRAHQRHLALSKLGIAVDLCRQRHPAGALRQFAYSVGHLRKSLSEPPVLSR